MTGFFPINQNTLYLLHLFYSDNEIITVHDRPAICTLISWIETSRLCLSFNKVSWYDFIFEPFNIAFSLDILFIQEYNLSR